MHELSPNALQGQTRREQLLLHVHHVPEGSESRSTHTSTSLMTLY